MALTPVLSAIGIPIDINECIGDSLYTINAAFCALDIRTASLTPPTSAGVVFFTAPSGGSVIIGGDTVNIFLSGDTTITGDLVLSGDGYFSKNLYVNGAVVASLLSSTGDLYADGDGYIGGNLFVDGKIVASELSSTGPLTVDGDTLLKGDLDVLGDARIQGKLTASELSSTGPLTVDGDTTLRGNLNVSGNTFLGDECSDFTEIQGTLKFPCVNQNIIEFNGETTQAGIPVSDGAVVRYQTDYFNVNEDALVFEKTDVDQSVPAGGFVFKTRGNTTLENNSLIIRGDGKVGIGTMYPNKNLTVIGEISASDNVEFYKDLIVQGNVFLNANLNVNGNTTLGNDSSDITNVNGTLNANNNLNVFGNSTLGNDSGDTTTVNGTLNANNDLNVNGNTTLGDSSSDTTTVNGTLNANNDLNVFGNTTLGNDSSDITNVNGTLNANNNLNVFGDTTLGDSSSDTTTVNGNLNANNNAVIGQNLTVNGTATIGTLTTGATDSVLTESSGLIQKRTINSQVWDTNTAFIYTQHLVNNSVTNEKLRDSAAVSVIGREGNTPGDPADITGTANQVLRINSDGTALAFGSINIASTAAVDGTLPINNGGTAATNAIQAVRNLLPPQPLNSGKFLSTNGSETFWSTVAVAGSGGTVTSVTGLDPIFVTGNTTDAVVRLETVPTNKGGTGQISYNDGELLIGNSTGGTLTKNVLSGGDGVTIENGAGYIKISTEPLSGYVTQEELDEFFGRLGGASITHVTAENFDSYSRNSKSRGSASDWRKVIILKPKDVVITDVNDARAVSNAFFHYYPYGLDTYDDGSKSILVALLPVPNNFPETGSTPLPHVIFSVPVTRTPRSADLSILCTSDKTGQNFVGQTNPGSVINSTINAVEKDPNTPNSGWIGGAFKKSLPLRIAKFTINSPDGTPVLTALPGLTISNGRVYALKYFETGGTKYLAIGGDFTNAGGASRLLIYNLTTNNVAKTYILNRQVNCISFFDNVLYVGGNFSTINDGSGTYTSIGFAAFDGSSFSFLPDITTNLTLGNNKYMRLPTNPSTGAVEGCIYSINQMTVNGVKLLFIVGYFNYYVGGTTLSNKNVLVVDLSTKTRFNWTFGTNGRVFNSLFTDIGGVNKLSIMGSFTTAGTDPSKQVANKLRFLRFTVTPDGGSVAINEDSYYPSFNKTVYSAIAIGSNVLVQGDFSSVGGSAHGKLCYFDYTQSSPTANVWSSNAKQSINVTALGNTMVQLNGSYTFNNINSSGSPSTISVAGPVLIGGAFSKVNSATRNRFTLIASPPGLNFTSTDITTVKMEISLSKEDEVGTYSSEEGESNDDLTFEFDLPFKNDFQYATMSIPPEYLENYEPGDIIKIRLRRLKNNNDANINNTLLLQSVKMVML
jgi:cytoskeletal protein CcmA (bactofilin family)